MLKAERMRRALVVGTQEALPGTVDYLYRLGHFHVVDFKETDGTLDIGTSLPGSEKASGKLLKMMSISQNLGLADAGNRVSGRLPTDKLKRELDAAISHLELELGAEVHARKETESLLSEKRSELAALASYAHVDFPLSLLRRQRALAVFCGRLRTDPEKELATLTSAYEILRGDSSIIIVDKALEREVSELLARCGFVEVPLPSSSGKPLDEAHRLEGEISELERRLREVDGRIARLREKNELFILASIEELSIQANTAETPLRFGAGKHAFLIDGWFPEKELDRVRSGLADVGDGAVELIEVSWIEGSDEPPIRLDNPKTAKPMEMLIEMFSLPKYGEIDPTVLMLATFPIFYGLMLGDWGYGIVLVVLSLSGAFKKLMDKLGMSGGAPGLSKILLYCGISSIVFGLVYDEFFGFEPFAHWDIGAQLLGIALPVHRAEPEMVGTMLMFCVYVGVVHLLMGYAIGIYNVRAEHGLRTAILEKGGWIFTLVGLVMFAVTALPGLLSGGGLPMDNVAFLSGIVLMAVGIVMTAVVEKINGILELPGLASNLLSYTRIFAIGLSSIGIALAFNEEMAMPAIEGGGIGIILGILILVMGHGLNIALGIIGPLIQSLRLHYVEFFTKFYKGGGVRFNPLSVRRKYTKEV
ncbi:MAG: V-type ATP synthase subunit I [Methanobacteriota archaeon]